MKKARNMDLPPDTIDEQDIEEDELVGDVGQIWTFDQLPANNVGALRYKITINGRFCRGILAILNKFKFD